VFAQVVSALVDGGVDIATAVAAPRWSATPPVHLAPPDRTEIEARYHPDVIDGLRARGQDPVVVDAWSSSMGHAHAIELVRDPSDPAAPPTFAAAADPRSEGLPGAC
jgi:gamma-glutamyltranspeptidase